MNKYYSERMLQEFSKEFNVNASKFINFTLEYRQSKIINDNCFCSKEKDITRVLSYTTLVNYTKKLTEKQIQLLKIFTKYINIELLLKQRFIFDGGTRNSIHDIHQYDYIILYAFMLLYKECCLHENVLSNTFNIQYFVKEDNKYYKIIFRKTSKSSKVLKTVTKG